MDSEPFRQFVFCHYCNQWGIENQFSVTTRVIGGVVRQLLYHTTAPFYDTPSVSHIANHHNFEGDLQWDT
jgi:23S rRNA maturation-related 3'-5' exoribonuclease YhaM